MTTQKKKAFGQKRIGTGTVSEDAGAKGEQWINSISSQAHSVTAGDKILSKFVPIELVSPDPDNPRKLDFTAEQIKAISKTHPLQEQWLRLDCNDDWLEGYLASIGENYHLNGSAMKQLESIITFAVALREPSRLINPISVWRHETQFIIISGERRFLAHLLLNAPHIAAIIKDEPPTAEAKGILQWDENAHREDIPLKDAIDQFEKILSLHDPKGKLSVRQLANLIGKSKSVAQRYQAIVRCPHTELREAIAIGKVGNLKKAAELAQLSRKDLLSKLNPEPAAKHGKNAVRVGKKANLSAMSAIIEAAARGLSVKSPLKVPLTSPMQAAEVLEKLIDQVEASRGA